MISTKGPVPLLVLAILFSIALFFAYKDLSALRLRLAKLESDLPTQIQVAVEALSPRAEPETHAFVGSDEYADFSDVRGDLQDFAEEAAAVFGEEFENAEGVGRWELDGDSPPSPAVLEDITEVSEVDDTVVDDVVEEVPVAAAKKRAGKKSV